MKSQYAFGNSKFFN